MGALSMYISALCARNLKLFRVFHTIFRPSGELATNLSLFPQLPHLVSEEFCDEKQFVYCRHEPEDQNDPELSVCHRGNCYCVKSSYCLCCRKLFLWSAEARCSEICICRCQSTGAFVY